ncbi:MAG: flavodoxin family protein [Sedimentisphaerales bacterium]|nr:flavodoxin family protein [Sedimentisphaerales bacterium]
MKIIALSCSPRKGQTTYKALQICLQAAQTVDESIETQIIELAGLDIRPCNACGACKNALQCPIQDDFASLIPHLADEDIAGMIIGTPVYLGSMTAQCKAFLDRSVMFRRNGWIFRNRVAGVVAVGGVRSGGQELTIQAVQAACLCHDMVCVSDGQPTAHFGATLWNNPSEGIDSDNFGIETAKNLGKRVAELSLKLTCHSRAGGNPVK